MITLILLHPLQSVPVQSWTFSSESIVRIGRSTDNDVILYSAVVSRLHVELRLGADGWKLVSLGANGTYLDEKEVSQAPVVDGMVIRLATSGPKIQIRIGGTFAQEKLKTANSERQAASKKNEPALVAFIDAPEPDLEDRTQVEGSVSSPPVERNDARLIFSSSKW